MDKAIKGMFANLDPTLYTLMNKMYCSFKINNTGITGIGAQKRRKLIVREVYKISCRQGYKPEINYANR
jgi:carboxyl-terminal processing protease